MERSGTRERCRISHTSEKNPASSLCTSQSEMRFLIFIFCSISSHLVSCDPLSGLSGTSDPESALQFITSINTNNCPPAGTRYFVNVLPGYANFESSTAIARMTANYVSRILAQNKGNVHSLSNQDYYNFIQNNIAGQKTIFGSAIVLAPGLHPKYERFAPYAYLRNGDIVGQNLAEAYDYTTPSTLWYAPLSRRTYNDIPQVHVTTKIQGSKNAQLETTLVVSRKDCTWTTPYFDCGAGNAWLITHVCPILYQKKLSRRPRFRGVGTVDIDLSTIDINQCKGAHPVDQWSNAFSGTDKCPANSQCRFKRGFGLKRGGYQCECERGFYSAGNGVIEGEALEKAHITETKDLSELQCHPCQKGCEECSDAHTCLWPPNFKSGYGRQSYGSKRGNFPEQYIGTWKRADGYDSKWYSFGQKYPFSTIR